MTPPSLSSVAALPIGTPARPTSFRPARRRGAVTAHLCPSHASAVIVPPLVVYLGCVVLAGAAGRFVGTADWRLAAITALLLPVVYGVGTLLRGLGHESIAAWTAAPLAVCAVVGLDAAVIGSDSPELDHLSSFSLDYT